SNGVLYDGTKMAGPADLRAALLSKSDALLRNFTDNLMSYAVGRRIEYFDQPTVRAIVRKAGQNGNHFSAFVLGIVNSAAFQMSRGDAATTPAQWAPPTCPSRGSTFPAAPSCAAWALPWRCRFSTRWCRR